MSETPSLLLVHGDERFLVDGEARAWLARARQRSASELNVEVFEAPARLDPLRRSLTEVPFLDTVRHVLVRDPPQLAERGRRGADGPDELVAALAGRAASTVVCLVAHTRVAPTNAVVRAIQQMGGTVSVHAALRGRDLHAWLERRLLGAGLRAPRAGVDHLLRVAGGDLGVLDGDVAKLTAYAAGGDALTVEAVRAIAAGDEHVQVWDVIERLLSRPPGRGPAALDALLDEGVSTAYLVATLAGQLRELLVAQDVLTRRPGGAAVLARQLGVPPWRAERLARHAGSVPGSLVEGWLRQLQRLDAGSKAGKLGDADTLRAFGLRAARDMSLASG